MNVVLGTFSKIAGDVYVDGTTTIANLLKQCQFHNLASGIAVAASLQKQTPAGYYRWSAYLLQERFPGPQDIIRAALDEQYREINLDIRRLLECEDQTLKSGELRYVTSLGAFRLDAQGEPEFLLIQRRDGLKTISWVTAETLVRSPHFEDTYYLCG